MNYEEAMSFLEDTKKYGCQPGLSSIRALMGELSNVQELVPVVHIGGTNGKGSVGAMLSAVLVEAGYRVGRFNTPDVFSYEEEFLMNGEPIARERLARLFTEVASACVRLVARGLPHPTRFEVETAAAFLWFYEEKCDIALVEVGMGGAEDATNLISHPLVSVLTSISMDHMKFLGDTLAKIAMAKAGIIKPGCPVVSMAQKPEALAVIRDRAQELGAKFIISDMSEVHNVHLSVEGTKFEIPNHFLNDHLTTGNSKGEWECADMEPEECEKYTELSKQQKNQETYKELLEQQENQEQQKELSKRQDNQEKRKNKKLSRQESQEKFSAQLGLLGNYQVANAVCALHVLAVLRRQFGKITEEAVLAGLRKVRWPGRLELIRSDNLTVILDGAHNEDAVMRLRESLDFLFADKKLVYIMGVLADKEYEKMISIMFRPGDVVFTLTPPNPRALSARDLADELRAKKIHAMACETPEDALRYAQFLTMNGKSAWMDCDNEKHTQFPDETFFAGEMCEKPDVIVAFGSLYYLGGMRGAVEKLIR